MSARLERGGGHARARPFRSTPGRLDHSRKAQTPPKRTTLAPPKRALVHGCGTAIGGSGAAVERDATGREAPTPHAHLLLAKRGRSSRLRMDGACRFADPTAPSKGNPGHAVDAPPPGGRST
ncbi:hypothetical protein C2845_PM01G28300 [Panicum miliaceum]|uniref:Uncharacterized protein n=1 Tax=Panicum miliaceum TaxID=4540 RepID=A0A3L6TMV7_PANMI|nr:hypothetical protein C2845_PM01G28300 [Panicum miliaceum]